jgi:hypothetical protein
MSEDISCNNCGVKFSEYEKLKQENEKLRECVEFYAYPKHEDGDRAYIFGHEARETLKELESTTSGRY